MDKPTILVVEDDPRISQALNIRLTAAGYSVVTAADGAGGVAAIDRQAPDLILLDISMPAGGGFFVAEHLMRRPGGYSVPIIFVTATQAPGVRERAEEFFPVAYVEKPFGSDELLDIISRVLSGQVQRPRTEALAPAV